MRAMMTSTTPCVFPMTATRSRATVRGASSKKARHKLVLEAEGTTVDMLSAYYYMRSLPFPMWDSGHTECINIFSGKRKELLTIKYHGIEEAKSDNKT